LELKQDNEFLSDDEIASLNCTYWN